MNPRMTEALADVVICEPVRTAVGRRHGVFAPLQAADLAAAAITGLLERTGLGTADVDSDGSPETVLALQCSGSPPESCCAGRTSLLWFVAAFDAASDELRLKGPVIRGTPATPGDEDGPAFRAIEDARLDGASVVTTERISYAEQYTFDQVGGDPQAPVTVSYRRSGAGWEATVG